MTVQAYPLQWPSGKKRNQNPVESNFKTELSTAVNELFNEIFRLGGHLPVLSSNMQLRADGMPYTRQSNIEDTGIAVYFTYKGDPACFSCDKYIKLADNVQAIRKTIEALRGIERWGSSDMMETAFSGFLQLPAPGQSKVRSWREVFGVAEGIDDIEYIKHVYKRLSSQNHPDKGGNSDDMAEINNAWLQAQEALK